MIEFKFRENNFNLIRLLAAFQVILLHGYHWFGFSDGWFVNFVSLFPGVPIFFVTSGFLLSKSLDNNPRMYLYFRNRILRIYPALYVCFIVGVLVATIFHELDLLSLDFIKFVFAQLTFLQFYNPDTLFYGYGTGVLNGSLWTISVELQFYILLPIAYPILHRILCSKVATINLMLILISLYYLKIHFNDTIKSPSYIVTLYGVSILPYLYLFIIGIIIQNNIPFVKMYLVNKGILWIIVYIILSVVLNQMGINVFGNNLNPFSALILSFLVVAIAYTKYDILHNLLGDYDISYGVYLYHMLVVNVLLELSFTPLQNILIMWVITIILAIASWKLIEKPLLALKQSIKSV